MSLFENLIQPQAKKKKKAYTEVEKEENIQSKISNVWPFNIDEKFAYATAQEINRRNNDNKETKKKKTLSKPISTRSDLKRLFKSNKKKEEEE